MKHLQATCVICCSVIVFSFLVALLISPDQTLKVSPAYPTVHLFPKYSSGTILVFTTKGTRERVAIEEYVKRKMIK